jgi:V8-like Glu-specific endopeptidase
MTPQMHRFILHPRTARVFLSVLAGAYLVYLGVFVHALTASQPAQTVSISVYPVTTSPTDVTGYWTAATMQAATDENQPVGQASTLNQTSADQSAGKAARQDGQPSQNSDLSYPLSTVGKLFFTSASGLNHVCSGTAVVSANKSVVDTAGHCLYYQGGWSQNVIFCPLYDNGPSSYGCWAARDLEVPSQWIDNPTTYARDFGMAVVAPNSQGNLTDVVGGVGWSYNQPTNQSFSAYGYPAALPFDGQTRQTCPSATGTSWQFGGGTVVSIPCNMTGGSSGGPWFVQINGAWYLNGHNDFTSSLKQGHMFSPYYDDTWYALYSKAQQT